jgi:hypothetical protein
MGISANELGRAKFKHQDSIGESDPNWIACPANCKIVVLSFSFIELGDGTATVGLAAGTGAGYPSNGGAFTPGKGVPVQHTAKSGIVRSAAAGDDIGFNVGGTAPSVSASATYVEIQDDAVYVP